MRNSRKKTVVIEKDGVQAEATRESFQGLVARGWKVVGEDKDAEKAAEEQRKEQEKLEEQEVKIFGPADTEGEEN